MRGWRVLIGAPVCEHGYQVAVIDRAVRHVATHGVCLDQDAAWRERKDADKADPALVMDEIEARADG